MPDATLPSIRAALLPQVAPDAFLLSDGAPQYQRIATAAGLGCWMRLVTGRRSRHAPKTCQLNTVNSLHAQRTTLVRPFCGPAATNLEGYARWLIARPAKYRPAFHSLLA